MYERVNKVKEVCQSERCSVLPQWGKVLIVRMYVYVIRIGIDNNL